MSQMSGTSGASEARWFGQPPGLTILFLTEMWERFSYYGMRALLIYYMTRQLLIGPQQASLIYGIYTGCIYLTPILGGYLADRVIGRRAAVIIGGATMAVGHLMMASEPLFYAALCVIVLGNGLFLPSLPSQIVDLYREDDPRRKSAYSVYYVGVNLGGFLAPLVCGALGETLGWHWGFGAAGVGMIIGLLIYLAGGRWLPADGRRGPAPPRVEPRLQEFRRQLPLLLGIAAAVVVFRSAYEQVGNTIALWAESGIDRTVSGQVLVPMTWFQSLNPLLVFLLTPILIAHWRRRAAAGAELSSLAKMSLGALMVGGAYGALALVALVFEGSSVRPTWLILAGFFVLLTLGELFILPVGLGLFGRLAPAGRSATTIAGWYLAAFAGNLCAGVVGSFWSTTQPAQFFAALAGIAAAAALILTLLRRRHGASAEDGPVLDGHNSSAQSQT